MSELLIYASEITPRITYVFQLFFDSLIKTPYLTTSDEEVFKSYNGPKLNYSANSYSAGELQIIPCGLLTDTGTKEQLINVTEWNNMKVFFRTDQGSLPFDVFSASFYLVSRYEEYLTRNLDEHRRFRHINSVAYKNHFLDEPLINYWAEELKKVIQAKYPSISIVENKYSFISTIDVDVAYAHLGRNVRVTIASYFKALLRFDIKAVFEKKLVFLHLKKDPYDTFEYQEKLFAKNKLRPIYFFLAGKRGPKDRNISPKSRRFKKLLKKLSAFAEIGIHPSYQSESNVNVVAKEIANVSKNISETITSSRQHYLRIRLPETYYCLAELGITDDYSMAYAGTGGFRASICTPFFFYDLQAEKVLPVKIHSCAIMDGTLKDYLGLLPRDCMSIIGELINKVRKSNGEFIAIWHNHSLSEDGGWKGWRKIFENMIEIGK